MTRGVAVALLAAAAGGEAAAQPAPPAAEAAVLDARTIMERSYRAMGGDAWARARTLKLEGRAVFWGEGPQPRAVAPRYVMWRVLDPGRAAAHAADGKVRIEADLPDGRPMIRVGFDGETTWNEKGVVPRAEADAFWASNFGYGIVRHALREGFRLERLPDDEVEGHPVFTIRVTDPAGTPTLFGIDQKEFMVRRVGFVTPRGYHERTYGDFFRPARPAGWLQPGRVTLFYNGVKANMIVWERVTVDEPIPDSLFAPPPPQAASGR
jgi:hypothetical protein